jgi:hypothetical protein
MGKPAKELPGVAGDHLTVEAEGKMSRSERRFAIRKLLRQDLVGSDAVWANKFGMK